MAGFTVTTEVRITGNAYLPLENRTFSMVERLPFPRPDSSRCMGPSYTSRVLHLETAAWSKSLRQPLPLPRYRALHAIPLRVAHRFTASGVFPTADWQQRFVLGRDAAQFWVDPAALQVAAQLLRRMLECVQ